MTPQTEAELEATEGTEFTDEIVEQEIAEANRIAVMEQADFVKDVMPSSVIIDGQESAEEASSYFDRFEDFIGSLGIRHFRAQEFLMMGSSNAAGRSCAGRNAYPPESSWRTMAPSALMLDEIRHRLGLPVIILSGYRNTSYNSCIGGASLSQHKRFCAFDFAARGGSSSQWWSVAKEVRSSNPDFAGGIGKYNSFVHIDTRGHIANW